MSKNRDKRKKLSNEDILTIIVDELINAPVNNNLEAPLAYYLGLPNGTEVEGKSQLTSTDVADSIEWIIPQIMKSFTQTNEIVIFDPINQDDEIQAELESEYVYNIIMKKNDGFITIHEFVKDALMQRNGIIKVFYEDDISISTKSYTGLNEPQLQMLVATPNIELLELSEEVYYDDANQPFKQYDVKISVTKTCGKIKLVSVPPEEFRVNSSHNSINLENARFTAHVTNKTVSELLKAGVPQDVIDELSSGDTNQSDYRFQLQGEQSTLNTRYI